MTGRHHLAEGTHTVLMAQVRQITDALSALPQERRDELTADVLGMAGETARLVPAARAEHRPPGADADLRLPGGALLHGIRTEGPPDFPYVWGRFTPPEDREAAGERPWLEAALHTAALRRLSHDLGLRHRWGLDA